MLIDLLSGASNDAPSTVPPGASPEAPVDSPDAFAALLEEIAGESGHQSATELVEGWTGPAAEAEADLSEQPMAPFVVPFPFMAPVPPDVQTVPGASIEMIDGIEGIEATSDVDPEAVSNIASDVPLESAGIAPIAVVPATDQTPRVADAAEPQVSERPVIHAGPVQPMMASADTSAPVVQANEAKAVSAQSEPVSTEPAGPALQASSPKDAPAMRTSAARQAAQPEPVENTSPSTGGVDGRSDSVRQALTAVSPDAVAAGERLAQEMTSSTEAVPGIKSAAARLARALERAAESGAVHVSQPVDVQTGQEFSQSGQGESSLGDWLRDQLAASSAPAPRLASASPVFTMAPLHVDARMGGALADAVAGTEARMPLLPSERDVTSQLLQSLRVQFRDGIGEAVLKLRPEHLGSVSISLKIENGGIKASVQAEVASVRQWLESQQDSLRQGLAEHGLRLDRFVVDPEGQRERSSEQSQDESSKRRRPARRNPQGEPVFEVLA